MEMPIQWARFRLIQSLFAAADQPQNFFYESPGGPTAAGLLDARVTSQALPPAGPFPQWMSGCGAAGKRC